MMRTSMPLAALARATASSTIATTCSLLRPLPGMEQRRKAYLGVDHAVAAELRKEIVHHQAQRLLALHQRDVVRRRAQVFGQAAALGRRNEVAGKRLGRDVRGQAPHDVVAQAAVEVQVELDFGQGAQVHVSTSRICP